MTVRERIEQAEHSMLCTYATFSDESKGRSQEEPPCPLRPCFQRDRDRIIHCKAFRRLKQKTQVFLSPEGDHYRTRLTHTLEVAQIARTIARALQLNEDLTEAIALGHDLGHTPFGHAGERALNQLNPSGFHHYMQSVRVVEFLEKDGRGLNLSLEVLNGIACHTTGEWPATREGCIVRYADHIAYINHDIEDAISAGVLLADDIPARLTAVLGDSKSARITTMICDMVAHGAEKIGFSPEIDEAYHALRAFMFETVYVDATAKKEEKKVDKLLGDLYAHWKTYPEHMPQFFTNLAAQRGTDRAVTDYISGMTDEYAVRKYEELFIPRRWQVQ